MCAVCGSVIGSTNTVRLAYSLVVCRKCVLIGILGQSIALCLDVL